LGAHPVFVEVADLHPSGQELFEAEDVLGRRPAALDPSLNLLIDRLTVEGARDGGRTATLFNEPRDGRLFGQGLVHAAILAQPFHVAQSKHALALHSVVMPNVAMSRQTIGARLRDFAALPPLNWTAKELAERLGISYETLRRWINGDMAPNRRRVKAICEILHVSPEWVLLGLSNGHAEKRTGSTLTGLADAPEGPESDDLNRAAQLAIPFLMWSQVTLANLYNDDESLNLINRAPCASASVTRRSKRLAIGDSAMEPLLSVGDSVQIEPDMAAEPGDIVLVRDSAQAHHLREYRARPGGAFEAYPHNPAYATLESVRDGLDVIAVATHFIRELRRRLPP
jgi:transcriptional regulator with XRE-family HTH domain